MQISTILKASFLAVLFATLVQAEEPVFQPWIPQHLDDWPALVAEAKAYVETTNAAQKATKASIQFFVRAEDQPLMLEENLPAPPKNIFPGDHITLMFTTVKDNTSSNGFGAVNVWRAVKRGAAGVTIGVQINKKSPSWPFPDQNSMIPVFDAQIQEQKPSSGVWKTRLHDFGGEVGLFWLASWERLDDRARTRDDAQGIARPLRPEDLRWLSGAPSPVEYKAESPVDSVIYQARVKAHAGVQQGLSRFRSGFLARPVIVYEVERNGIGEKLGIKPGDTPIAVGTSRVCSAIDFKNKLRSNIGSEKVIRFARSGSDLISIKVTSEKLGIGYADAIPDPGMAVLEVVAKADVSLVTDAAVMMYAYTESDLTECALSRLRGHIPEAALAFMRAWNATTHDDIGGVEVLLSPNFSPVDGDLSAEIDRFKQANRARSGRFIWAWPAKAKDTSFDTLIRHLLSSLPEAERFTLFDGKLDKSYFSLMANDRVQPIDQAGSLLGPNGGIMKASGTYASAGASFGNIPDRCQMTFNFTLIPILSTLSKEGNAITPSHQFLSVGFETRSAQAINNGGMGEIRMHANGYVSFHPPHLDSQVFDYNQDSQPLPIPVLVDGTAINTLRIIRIAQTQRIELNGHLISQGFLPLISGTEEAKIPHLGIVLSVKDAECRISDVMIKVPKEGVEPNGF